MKSKILFNALYALTLLTTGYAQTPDKAKLDQYFDRLAEKNKAMGSLVIVSNGNVVYNRSIGYSAISGAEKKTLSAQNRFRIGSITKMFTAAMILQLAEEGKLKLNDHLDHFFPQIPNAQKITIEQMLRHRSGIPNVRRDEEGRKNVNEIPMTREERLALIVAGTPDFDPGTQHLYSNSAFHVLGFIIEKITGKPYATNLAERITNRIGLKDTYVATGNIDVSKNEALTYMFLNNEWKQVPETHPSILFSAGAIVSTPGDLVKFIQLLFDGKIISKESLDKMKTIQDGEGLGMEPFALAGKTFYGHAGGGDNYGAWLAYLPEERLALAYTTNAKVYPVRDIVNNIVDIYYNNPFDIPTFEPFAVSPEILDKYVGVYSMPGAPVKFTISRKDSTLFIKANQESPAPLEATAQDKFKIEGAIVVEFDTAKKQMIIRRGGGQRIFTKEN